MEIIRLDVPVAANARPVSLGLRLAEHGARTHVDLFALDDNKGPWISDNLWKVARHIGRDIVDADKADWTLTAGDRTTSLNFGRVQYEPFKLNVSDRYTFENEKFRHAHSLERYARTFRDRSPSDARPELERERVRRPAPLSVFTVPCAHPAAKDGVFHCIPSYYDSDPVRESFDFIVADTKKIIGVLKRSDPEMMTHADHKFRGDTAAQWLEATSMTFPREMGHWVPRSGLGGLTMNSGQAALIKLVQVLDLPFFPIAVEKQPGTGSIRQINAQIGYTPVVFNPSSLMKQVYRSPLGQPSF